MQAPNHFDMAVVVSSPDSYHDIFDVFIHMFRKNWPDCKYPLVLSNNLRKCDYPGVTVVNSGEDAVWGVRVLRALEKLDVPYVLLITEDSIISDRVDCAQIEGALQCMKEHDLKYYRLYNSPKASGKSVPGRPGLHYINQRQPYGLNLMAAIWDREYFIEAFGDGEYTGWDIEGGWLQNTLHAPNAPFEGFAADIRDVLHIVHGVYKGKWMPSALSKLKRQGYHVDVGPRGAISFWSELILKLKRGVRNVLSIGGRKKVKAVLSKVGFRFATRY